MIIRKTKYCSFCNNELPNEAKFCPFCGKQIDNVNGNWSGIKKIIDGAKE